MRELYIQPHMGGGGGVVVVVVFLYPFVFSLELSHF